MPRRQVKEIPRWRRGQQSAPPLFNLSRRQQKRLVQQAASGFTPASTKAANDVLARSGAYRYRKQILPFWWLAGIIAAGLITHAARAVPLGLLTGLASGAGIWLLTRHLGSFTRHASGAMAILTALWLPALALAGFVKPLPPLLLACWLCVLVPWVRHYRWRPEAVPAEPAPGDTDVWARLAKKHKWSGHLEGCEEIPGGRRWGIVLDGAETHIGEVMAQPRRIAAAWGKPITGAYAEPARDGIESRGTLTILRKNTLEQSAEWDGAGVDPQTGCATIARFPDALAARIRFFALLDGIRHGLIAGTTGAGKSYLLDLIIRIALTTGYIVPVVLDPQEGQSLPQWREHVLYASGVEACMNMLRGLHAGMLDRSRYLSSLRWRDEDGFEHKGMDFYDPFLTGLPIVLVIGDEHPVLLTDPVHGKDAIRLTADIGKRGRKTGEALWPVAQVPSLSELGDQVVRSMLAGGNVVCLRTGDRVSAGMLGLDADPSALPRYFPDGTPTWGLGYVIGPDQCQAPARVLTVSRAARRETPVVPALDERFAAAMDRAMANGGVQLPLPPSSLAAVPSAAEEDSGPEGRTCADAVLAVLDAELDRGVIIERVRALSETWGRPKPFSIRSIGLALQSLSADGRIAKPQHNSYAPVRASLHVVDR